MYVITCERAVHCIGIFERQMEDNGDAFVVLIVIEIATYYRCMYRGMYEDIQMRLTLIEYHWRLHSKSMNVLKFVG